MKRFTHVLFGIRRDVLAKFFQALSDRLMSDRAKIPLKFGGRPKWSLCGLFGSAQ
jgi:hypothetical protein